LSAALEQVDGVARPLDGETFVGEMEHPQTRKLPNITAPPAIKRWTAVFNLIAVI
jgi:hypothetical protein